MRAVRAWAAAAALLAAGAGASLCAAEPVNGRPKGLINYLFGKDKKPAAAAAPEQPPAPRVSPREQAARQLQRAQAEYFRRLAVCDKFRLVALQTGDDALLRQAEALERQATEVYQQSIAHLPCSRLRPAEELLDERLGTGSAVNPLTSAARPDEGGETDRTRQASVNGGER
ncbi:MAG TPA: hypothetical protein VIL46_13465 [Gemmataceae bacterium]